LVFAQIERAKGGVLFVDEAYRLVPAFKAQEKDYGLEALEEIMAAMDEGALVVILAGEGQGQRNHSSHERRGPGGENAGESRARGTRESQVPLALTVPGWDCEGSGRRETVSRTRETWFHVYCTVLCVALLYVET